MNFAMKEINKVFIAIRTDIFNVPDEHITVAYFEKASIAKLVSAAEELRRYVPTDIQVNGFANWRAPNGSHMEVALIDAFKNPLLFRHVRTPHITIRRSNGPLSNATFVPQLFGEVQTVDSLWVGKNVMGKMQWLKIENEPIMETAMRSWQILGGI